MVFESVVADVLNKVIGDYVENLDRNQLKIGIWGGDVVLKNLSLRENALDDLDLPVQLVYGYLGTLVLKIPWKNLYKQPVVVQIEDFYALVSPKQAVPYDAEKEERYELQAKQNALTAVDERRKKELEKDKPKPDATFAEKLTAQIVNNLQVKIANVHLRYEDTTTTGKPFSFGVSLFDLDFYTTDENWMNKYLTEQVSHVFKVGNLDSLSVYMNCHDKLFAQYDKSELAGVFRDSIARKDIKPMRFTYVLGPISSLAKLELNMNPEYDNPPFVKPKVDLGLEMERLNVGLTSTQFQDIIKFAESMNRMQLGVPYRKYRPYNIPYKNHYKAWWKFAITAVLEVDIRRRQRSWTWAYIKEHRQLCNQYAMMYKEKELTKKPSSTLIESVNLLENRLDLFNLLLIRQRAQIDLEKIREEEARNTIQKKEHSWFGGWFSGPRQSLETEEGGDIVKKIEAAMTDSEKQKLYTAIGYEENATIADVPKDYVALKMNFRLEALIIGLYDDEQEQLEAMSSDYVIDITKLKTICLLEFLLTSVAIKQRPAASAVSISAGMRELKLTGVRTGNDLPTLLESVNMGSQTNLLDVFFETNPFDGNCDHRLHVSANSLRFIYDAKTILSLLKVFAPPKSLNLSELESVATEKLANVKERSATGMKYIIDEKDILEIDIKLQPNVLIIPRNGAYRHNDNINDPAVIIICLGAVNVKSQNRDRNVNIPHLLAARRGPSILESIFEQAYDRINVSVEKIQILVAKGHEDWQDVITNNLQHEMHILSPTSIIVDLSLCIIDNDPRLPKTKINILLPGIDLHITEDRMLEALKVLLSIPMPETDNLPEPGALKRAMSSASRLSRASFMYLDIKKFSTKKPEITTDPEIVQCTDLELSFTLNVINVSLVKSLFHQPADKESPIESNFGTPVNEMTNSEFQDSLSNLGSAESFTENPLGQEHLLSLKILQLEAKFAQRTYETVAEAKLGAIKMNQHNEKNELNIVDTPRFSQELQYLLEISFIMADKKAPEFKTKYNCTEQMIIVKFATLNVILHQEYILRLLNIADSLQNKFEAVRKHQMRQVYHNRDRLGTAADINIISTLATIVEEVAASRNTLFDKEAEDFNYNAKTTSTRHSKRHGVVNSIKIHVRAYVQQVSLLLTCELRDIALLKVEQLDADVVLKSSYTELNLRLKDILVTDMNPENIHSNIMSICGNEVLNCQVVLFNVEETQHYNKDNMKVNVEIGCMKIVFLNWFVSAVLNFLNNFQTAINALAEASAAAAETAKATAVEAYSKSTRIKLSVKMKAPIIVVPVNSQSRDAIALDLGMFVLSNSISELNTWVSESDEDSDEDAKPVIDDITLELKNLKLSKVAIVADDNDTTTDTTDVAYGLKSNVNILDPISFSLHVRRNLSSHYYHDIPELDISGRLKPIELNLFMTDYALIMSILQQNFTEGADEFEIPSSTPVNKPSSPVRPSRQAPSNLKFGPRPSMKINKKIAEQLKFSFLFDGIVANLMQSPNEGLARFGIYVLSVKGSKLIDGTLSTSIVLCNIQIDDARQNINSKIRKYLCRKDWKQGAIDGNTDATETVLQRCHHDRNFMVDFTAIIKENDTYAEMRICGFDLILCVDYLLTLADFFKIPEEVMLDQRTKMLNTPQSRPVHQKSACQPDPIENRMHFVLIIEEPDIILVESLEDINTNAIIFNMQANLNYRVIGDRQIINGQIDALKMYMCSFIPERREATKHYIIHPCVISLQGSSPEPDSLHISLQLSDIIINVSPATIELLNKASRTLSSNSTDLGTVAKIRKDYSQVWEQHSFKDRDHWFVRIGMKSIIRFPRYRKSIFNMSKFNIYQDEADDALQLLDVDNAELPLRRKSEKCVLEIPSITIVVEMGMGYYTTPLIMLDTRMDAVISDWSCNMNCKGSLTLSMSYFNQTLATWEPIIEPNEVIRRENIPEYMPWELNFGLEIVSKPSEFDENIEEKTTKIKIHSEEILEMTLTKTFLDIVTKLGEVFSQAIDPSGLLKPEIVAPYAIENDTGFDVMVDFEHGIFTLHEYHMPHTSTASKLNKSLVFQANDIEKINLKPEEVKECILSPGGRLFLQTKDLSTINDAQDEEYNIHVQVGSIDKRLVLPVSKSDTRYFPLYRDTHQTPWGVVSEVRSEYGTTTINLHSVVNVENHFTTPVQIYRESLQEKKKVLVGEVAAGEVFHVPMHAIYAQQKELYFAIAGYSISVQGIRWDDSPTDMEYTRQMQCDPIDTFEPLYINLVRKKTEIYQETTNKYKLLSAFYTLHLRPPLFLRNALPISIKVSVAGCSVRTANGNLRKIPMDEEGDELDGSKTGIAKEELLDYGEKDVMPGDCLHLPTVKLASKNKESRSYLVVRLINYLEKDWSCTTVVSADYESVMHWKFTSFDSAAIMDMDLTVRFENLQGSLMLTIYSPFWMINKTGKMLTYKTDSETVDVLYHPPEYNGPILFSFRDKFLAKKKATIRVDNGEWSRKIPLDVAGSLGTVTCNSNDMTYQIGVHNYLTQNSLTKQITFIPFYVATNKCDFEIELQEQTRPGDPWIRVNPDACVPIWPINDSNNMIRARVQGQTTVAFNYSEAQITLLKLSASEYGGINVDVHTTEGGIYITFTEYHAGDAPGLLVNHSSRDIVFQEKFKGSQPFVLKKRHKLLYTWDNPADSRNLSFGNDKADTDLRRDGVGEIVLEDGDTIYWVSFLDGLQRVLLLTQIEAIATKTECSSALQSVTQSIEVRIFGIGLSVINNESSIDIMYLGVTSSGVIWESKKPNKKRYKQLNIQECNFMETEYQQYLRDFAVKKLNRYTFDKYALDFENMLLLKTTPRTIRRTFYPGVWIMMNTSPFQMQLHAKINKIQLDNQLSDHVFPVVLAPIPPPKTVASNMALKPFVECSIVQRVVPNSTVKQYKYATVLIQEFHFKVDLPFLTAIADLFTGEMSDEQAAKTFNEDMESIERPLSELVATHSLQENKNFYDNLHLGPLKIHVSFSMAGSDTKALPAILSTLVQGVGVTLTDVNDVVFRLAFFEREYQFLTQKQLTSQIITHYSGQALKQLYVLVLGLDVLGNPYGLAIGLKKGVEDLFYEPFLGAIQGPGEFAEGLVLGVKSLFGHTVGGAAGAVSKITGAMGKGLAALTFDEDYQLKRRQAMNVKPRNFQEGIARSGRGLVMGFVDGVTGVVTKPVSGAREEGIEGFFKGLGKGAVGLVTRPTAGVVDFASGSLEAVKQATSNSDEAKRLRAPRFFHEDQIIRPYCRSEANGNKLMKEIERGKFASTDHFVYCEEIVHRHEYALVSNHRIIYVTKNDLFGTWALHWVYLWQEIAEVKATDIGVEIKLKRDGRRTMGIFTSKEPIRKLLLISSRERREKFIEAVESQRIEN